MPRTIEQAKQNLEASIPVISGRYEQGIEDADWQGPASSDQAEKNWAGGVQQAIALKSRVAGIRRAGNEFWKQRAKDVGATRIGEGVRAGLDRYAANFGPVLSKIHAAVATLPPRTLDPMENLTRRAGPVVKAAHEAGKKGKR